MKYSIHYDCYWSKFTLETKDEKYNYQYSLEENTDLYKYKETLNVTNDDKDYYKNFTSTNGPLQLEKVIKKFVPYLLALREIMSNLDKETLVVSAKLLQTEKFQTIKWENVGDVILPTKVQIPKSTKIKIFDKVFNVTQNQCEGLQDLMKTLEEKINTLKYEYKIKEERHFVGTSIQLYFVKNYEGFLITLKLGDKKIFEGINGGVAVVKPGYTRFSYAPQEDIDDKTNQFLEKIYPHNQNNEIFEIINLIMSEMK